MFHLAWVGLWLSLNQNARPLRPYEPAVETTAVVQVGKFTVTGIVIQPFRERGLIVNAGIGWKLF